MADVKQAIYETIDELVSRKFDEARLDKTGLAVIVSRKAEDEFIVDYLGQEMPAKAANPDAKYEKGDTVRVLLPNGELIEKPLILGVAIEKPKPPRRAGAQRWKRRSIDFLDPVDKTRITYGAPAGEVSSIWPRSAVSFYAALATSKETNAPSPEKKKIEGRLPSSHSIGYAGALGLGEDYPLYRQLEFEAFAKKWEWLRFSVEFQTEIHKPPVRGRYWIRIELKYENETKTKREDRFFFRSFDLDFTSFFGDPYAFETWTKQEIVFKIPRGAVAIQTVWLLSDDAWDPDQKMEVGAAGTADEGKIVWKTLDANQAPIIQARNPSLFFVEPVDIEATPYFLEAEAWTSHKHKGYANFFLKGEKLVDRQSLAFLWFLEDPSYGPSEAHKDMMTGRFSNKRYFEYGGYGWRPVHTLLNKKVEDNANYRMGWAAEEDLLKSGYQYYHTPFKITIGADEFPPGIELPEWRRHREHRYKVVAIYRPKEGQEIVLSEEIWLNRTLVPGQEGNFGESYSNKHGSFLAFFGYYKSWSSVYPIRTVFTKEWGGEDGEIPPAPEDDPLGSYWILAEDGSWQLDPKTAPDQNFRGFYHAAPKTATKPIVVKQALLETVKEPADKDPNGWPGGNRAKQPVRYWTYHFFPDDANPEGIVQIEGPRSHVYNSDGTLLKNQLTEQIFTLVPRFINSRDQLPPIIDQGWYYADGKPVPNAKVEEIGTSRFGDNPAFSMLREVWVGSDGALRYKVLDRYTDGRVGLLGSGVDQNTLVFKLVLLSKVVEIPHTLLFSKAGQNGVNGAGSALYLGPKVMGRSEDPLYPDEWQRQGSIISSTIRPLVFYGHYSTPNTWVNDPDYKLKLTFEVHDAEAIKQNLSAREWDLRYPPNSYERGLEKTAFLYFQNGAENSREEYKARAILPDKGQSERPEKLLAFWGNDQEVLWRKSEGPDGVTLQRAKGAMFVSLYVFIGGGTYAATQAAAAIYPVDVVVFAAKPAKFDPRLLRTNLPREITYGAHGTEPEGPRGPVWVSYGAEETSAKSKVGWGLLRNGADGLLYIKYDYKGTFRYEEPWDICWIEFSLEDGTKGWFGRPVMFRIRQYENPSINGWDGVSISLDEKDGTVLAPTIGAGWKNPTTGTFTGVVMGLDKAFRRPNNNQGVFGDYGQVGGQRPEYLTGLFGYQNGKSAFGLLESGLAFFGGADAGGRIWIDGRSGVISGGAAPKSTTQWASDDLAHSMRITLVDLSRIPTLQGSTENQSGIMGGDLTSLQKFGFGSYSTNNFRRFFSPAKDPYDTSAGFSEGVGFSTPAIEIGSYREFLYRGKAYIQTNPDTGQPYRGHDMIKKITPKEAREWQTQIEALEIPHYRKFLVTYDGTLYAMNAFIKGNIISSNIIGSQIFNLSGTFGVTDRGHMYIGGRGRKFTETYVENKGSWSKNPPTVSEPKTIEEILRTGYNLGLTSIPSNESAATTYEEAQTPFFVANDGRVFCQEIHISGESSINIGGFHVIPKGSSGRNAGDVYSYGTMYLIGPKYDPRTGAQYTTSVSRIALEAWGDLYLRGTLVNLGDVYLGSQTEKTYHSATSTFNSPFTIKAKEGGDEVSDGPSLPVRMSMWPLYFHAEENALASTGNHAWVTLSTPVHKSWSTQNQRSHYMPAFSRRADRSLIGDKTHQSPWVLWRLDQLGMWTDGIIFGNIDWAGGYTSYSPIEDNEPMSYEQHAHLFQGWKLEYGPEGASKWMFGIQNISGHAPSTLLEAPDSIRLEAGRHLHTKGGPSPQVGVYMFASTKERERAAGLLVAGRGSYTEKSHVYSFADTFAFVSRAGGSVDDMSKVAAIFSISTASLSNYDYADDLGNKLGKRFNQGDQYAGLIWARGTNIALDATKTIGDGPGGVANYSSLTSSIRLNRTPDGDSNAGLPSGVTANGLAYIGGLNIVLNGIQVDGNEASLYIRQISAENQHGIYARFG